VNGRIQVGLALCLMMIAGCASMLGDVNPVLMAVVKEDANRLRDAARLRESYEDGTPKIDGTNVCGERALHLAIQKNNLEIAQVLLQEGADPDLPSEASREPKVCQSFGLTRTPAGIPPLHYAISTARPRIAEALLLSGADPKVKTAEGRDAIELARGKAGLSTLVAYMESPLHLGARVGDLGKVRTALNQGADLEAALPELGTTPLEEALLSRRWYVVDFLMTQGAGRQATLSSMDVQAAAAAYLAENPDSDFIDRLRALQGKPVR